MNNSLDFDLRQALAAKQGAAPDAELVAIIGGGPAGLIAAWQLLERYGDRYIVVVLDGNTCHTRIGGNAYTVALPTIDTQAWADLGVNDYNAATYKHIQALLEKLGVEGKPLLDTTTWAGTRNGQFISYTGQQLQDGQTDCELARDYYRFKADAYNDAMYGGFFEYTLEQYAKEKRYSDAFLQWNLYPRVNGMYYVDQTRPAPQMPLGAIMRYYGLQEGFGTGPADRRFFVNGATHWLEVLADAIRDRGGIVAARHQVNRVSASGDSENPLKLSYSYPGCPWWGDIAAGINHLNCQKVIFAAHANVTRQLIDGIDGTETLQGLLDRIRYTEHASSSGEAMTRAIAHTDATVLPDPKQPSTYNITIHDSYEVANPYTITYWCNSHQNAIGNGLPDYYVTVNPVAGKAPDPGRILTTEFRAPDGSIRSIPAEAHFRHNTEGPETWEVQARVCETQQGLKVFGGGEFYFTGGWAMGAGLHEECWHASDIAVSHLAGEMLAPCRSMIGPIRTTDQHGNARHEPPPHLRVGPRHGKIG